MIGGVMATLLGAILLASLRLLERHTLTLRPPEQRIEDSVLAVLRALGTILVGFLAWIVLDGATLNVERGFFPALVITALLNVVIVFFSLKALGDKETDATLSVPILDTTPAIIIFLSWIILDQKPTALGYAGIILLVAGTYTLNIRAFVEKFHEGQWSLKAYFAPFTELAQKRGIRFAFCAALVGCVAINFDGMSARTGSPFLGAGLVYVPLLLVNVFRAYKRKALPQLWEWKRLTPFLRVYPLGFGLIISLYWWSMTQMIVPYQATLKRIETLALFVLAYLFLHEQKNARSRLLATVLISLGATLVALSTPSL